MMYEDKTSSLIENEFGTEKKKLEERLEVK